MARTAKVLIVEDYPGLAKILTGLINRHHHAEVCSSITEAVEKLTTTNYDLVISELTLPDGEGLELLAEIDNQAPMIVLTDDKSQKQRLECLEEGAADVLSKPFDYREFHLRCQYFVTQSKSLPVNNKRAATSALNWGPFKYEADSHELIDQRVGPDEFGRQPLTILEDKLVNFFFVRQNQIIKREDLVLNIWHEQQVHPRTIDTAIRRLRKKLADYGNLLQTLPRQGYRLVNPKATHLYRPA